MRVFMLILLSLFLVSPVRADEPTPPKPDPSSADFHALTQITSRPLLTDAELDEISGGQIVCPVCSVVFFERPGTVPGGATVLSPTGPRSSQPTNGATLIIVPGLPGSGGGF